jgi:outer membrane lipoprotein SlyB
MAHGRWQAAIAFRPVAVAEPVNVLPAVHATIIHLATSTSRKVHQRRSSVKKIVLAIAAATLVVPGASVVAADGFSMSKAAAGYKGDVSYQSRENFRSWRGKDGRTYCKRKNGTTGLVIGGAVGALAGREIAGRGDKTVGTIVGAAGGALIGREIDKGKRRCR